MASDHISDSQKDTHAFTEVHIKVSVICVVYVMCILTGLNGQ